MAYPDFIQINRNSYSVESEEAWGVVWPQLEKIGKVGFGYVRIPSEDGNRYVWVGAGTELTYWIDIEENEGDD